jgi:hypothetical protein
MFDVIIRRNYLAATINHGKSGGVVKQKQLKISASH